MTRRIAGIPTSTFALRRVLNFDRGPPNVESRLRVLLQHHGISSFILVSRLSYTFPNNFLAKTFIFKPFVSLSEVQNGSECEPEKDSDFESLDSEDTADQGPSGDTKTILGILSAYPAQEKCLRLDESGVKVRRELVSDVISRIRNDWEKAFTFFHWAGKQPGYEHSLREYHSMIAILGKFRKFDTAWNLINDMQVASVLTPRTLLIMIWKYSAVHDVAKAINTFYAHKRYKFEMGMEEFHGLLSALCRYKNVKDAEHLLFCNKTVFPFNTKSFNIILNGWFNVIGDWREGDRIWREMELRGIRHDVYSYSSIMACYSKIGNLNRVLRLFDKMKALGIEADRKVYNAAIHALAKGGLVNEARNLMKTMDAKGFTPNSITYNSLIMPLCKSRFVDIAKQMFDEMIEMHCVPTVRTYHSFFRILRTAEEVFELLKKMYVIGCKPCHETYIMLIRKFCRWRQLDDVFKLWNEMKENGLDPDRSSYIVLIHGLFLNGRVEEAYNYYQEMKEKHLLPEQKTEEMLQAWVAGKKEAKLPVTSSEGYRYNYTEPRQMTRLKYLENIKNNDFQRHPELRSFTRERGFSLSDHQAKILD